eukprot:14082169-Alexandrium_andersonii.AAC.1
MPTLPTAPAHSTEPTTPANDPNSRSKHEVRCAADVQQSSLPACGNRPQLQPARVGRVRPRVADP